MPKTRTFIGELVEKNTTDEIQHLNGDEPSVCRGNRHVAAAPEMGAVIERSMRFSRCAFFLQAMGRVLAVERARIGKPESSMDAKGMERTIFCY